MTPVASRPVGSTTARVVHGYTTGADAVLLGSGAATGAAAGGLAEALATLGIGVPLRVEGGLADQLTGLAQALDGADDRPFVAAAADLELALPALLDLLDRPGVGTAALVADPLPVTGAGQALARVGRDGRLVESVGTPAHVVTSPTHVLPGILRIAAKDREHAATLVRQAATAVTPAWGEDALTVAVLALVRGGLAVQASALGPFDWRRGAMAATGAAGDAWRQRLRGASRGGDGFFSTYAVRPLSRRLTAVGLAHDWAPNVVTVVSLGFGLLAALLVATGWRWAWALAAVVLLVALVVDCVDGELARFTRRFSPLGAFLDAVGDRVKEYAVLAAVAAVAVREGSPGWPVAIAAMAAVTVRHLEDYAYEYRLGPSRRSAPDLVPVDAPRDLGRAGSRTLPAAAPTTRQQAVYWTKKVIHMPIAERYLLLALTLLTRRPMLVLWTLFVAVCLAVLWTQGGRVAAVLLRRDPTWEAVPAPGRAGHLDAQLDLGPLARAVGAVWRATFPVGLLGAVLLVVGPGTALWLQRPGLAAVLALAGAAVVGAGWQRPVHHPLGWQAPAALWVAEVVTVCLVVHHVLGVVTAAGFSYLAAIAYHRYDVVYRLRDTGTAPGAWLTAAGLGADGRIVLVLLVAALAPGAVVPLLWAAALALAVLYLSESAAGWRSWIAAHPPAAPAGRTS